MKIAVIGANGRAGSLIAKEAQARGHEVTSVIREGTAAPGTKTLKSDLFGLKYADIQENEVIIDALGAWTAETIPQIPAAAAYLGDMLRGKQNRLLVVGGAGGLYVNPEHSVRLMDTPDFPADYMPLANAHGEALEALKARQNLRWTYLCPAADFRADGPRTGSYKLGGEELILSSAGESQISYADYAIAMVDEAEQANHIGKRFSVVAA